MLETYDDSSAQEQSPRRQQPRCLEPVGRVPEVGAEFECLSSHGADRTQFADRSAGWRETWAARMRRSRKASRSAEKPKECAGDKEVEGRWTPGLGKLYEGATS